MTIKLNSNTVSKYLADLEICSVPEIQHVQIQSGQSQIGRDSYISFLISLANSHPLLIKQDQLYHGSKTKSVAREWKLNKSFQAYSSLEIVHFDALNSILIFQCPSEYESLAVSYQTNKTFQISIATSVGNHLSRLHHQASADFTEEANTLGFSYPDYLLDKLKPETLLEELHPSGNNFIHYYQNSKRLRLAVEDLVAADYKRCLTHQNLQFHNIWLAPNEITIKFINWEKATWGNPAFDLGTVIANYLTLWIEGLILHPAIALPTALQLAPISLDTIRPSIQAFILSYLQNCHPDQLIDAFLYQVIQFTGLALIYKLITAIQCFQKFNDHSIYTLKLAENLLFNPAKSFDYLVGMAALELIHLSKVEHCE